MLYSIAEIFESKELKIKYAFLHFSVLFVCLFMSQSKAISLHHFC